ncbi:MAG: extracellular solute-binding protein [bacterium]|nr:extracellular solute-binding protein [bacterium]
MAKKRVRYKPLYEQVKELLLEQILEGEFQAGEAIPSESVLAENFETSVSTVRQAVSLLVGDGVLVKQQGKRISVSKRKTTLTFFCWIPETKLGDQIIREVIARFEKRHPSLKIECIPTTYYVAQKELVKLISSGNAPDVAQITSHWTSFFASMRALERLEPLLDESNLVNRAYDKELVGAGSYRVAFAREYRRVSVAEEFCKSLQGVSSRYFNVQETICSGRYRVYFGWRLAEIYSGRIDR